MTELRQEVRAFEVHYSCDQGDGGTMVSTGIEHKYTPTHQHRCTACGGVDYFHEKYPCIRYERVAGVTDVETERSKYMFDAIAAGHDPWRCVY